MATKLKTGFDKLVEAHSGVSVVPASPVPGGLRGGRDEGAREERGQELPVGRGSAPEAAAGRTVQRGRPLKYGKRETVPINFRIDADLKYQLEELKFRLHRSSVTDILVEAINDVVKKYSV